MPEHPVAVRLPGLVNRGACGEAHGGSLHIGFVVFLVAHRITIRIINTPGVTWVVGLPWNRFVGFHARVSVRYEWMQWIS